METESDFKFMTETLKLTNSNEDVADYIRWIITSDTAKKYWQSAHQNRIAELEKENEELKDKEIRGDRMLVELHHQIAILKSKSVSVDEKSIEEALRMLVKESHNLMEHCIDMKFIDSEEETDGQKDFKTAMDNALSLLSVKSKNK